MASIHEQAAAARLVEIVTSDPLRVRVLDAIARFGLPDGWVAAGFVRNAVWDVLHGYTDRSPLNDIDVVFFDPNDTSRSREAEIERALGDDVPCWRFSVKNQARMHRHNGDAPYAGTEDALRHWPETCTAVGVAPSGLSADVLAPFGLTDLFELRVRATSAALSMRALVWQRARAKGWRERWPLLVIEP